MELLRLQLCAGCKIIAAAVHGITSCSAAVTKGPISTNGELSGRVRVRNRNLFPARRIFLRLCSTRHNICRQRQRIHKLRERIFLPYRQP